MSLKEKLKIMIKEVLLKESNNSTTGRKSRDPEWIEKDKFLNSLIGKISFPVKAFVDPGYLDMFIYVNPKNRKALDEFMLQNKYTNEGSYYEPKVQPKEKSFMTSNSYQIKVKNKRDVGE